ncbi:conserved hypothetical protein [Paenibacillus curdlanolyticus YK9]|uniref:Uncharacterized protein n=1 Tax=Paenibacillus curdlanolyticus YK9 TaxID=717606 RepID=E0I3X2_9BACL|nr:hypothetical protein [Paenibacillus curdlanolyticus]EFM12986.1 conserved hypothetical protein [Paenibacillus curdlanolyticus YK9]
MGTFLDMRSSMNANASGSIGVSLTTTPQLFGIIGLQTRNVANPIVTLAGTIGISGGALGNTFTVEIVRGVTGGATIYTAEMAIALNVLNGNALYSFNAQDLNAPAAEETVYTAFISGGPLAVLTGARNGPETFYGTASSTV